MRNKFESFAVSQKIVTFSRYFCLKFVKINKEVHLHQRKNNLNRKCLIQIVWLHDQSIFSSIFKKRKLLESKLITFRETEIVVIVLWIKFHKNKCDVFVIILLQAKWEGGSKFNWKKKSTYPVYGVKEHRLKKKNWGHTFLPYRT